MNEQLEQLQVRADDILQLNASWKSCQDGSYEMSLSRAGYYKILDEINTLQGK